MPQLECQERHDDTPSTNRLTAAACGRGINNFAIKIDVTTPTPRGSDILKDCRNQRRPYANKLEPPFGRAARLWTRRDSPARLAHQPPKAAARVHRHRRQAGYRGPGRARDTASERRP